jgi:peptidoglycan/LPS O-acetylase OafA/YrhL
MFLYQALSNKLAQSWMSHSSMLLIAPTAVALAVLMGTCSYYLIELRFLRLKSKFTGQQERVVLRAAPVEAVS